MKSIKLDIQYRGFMDNDYRINSDQKRIQQVFLNLLSNSVKYTDRDGQILVLVERVYGHHLRVSVTDSGIGIKKKHKDKIFDLFSSTYPKETGMHGIGLGLVISKLIVNEFGGSIDFFSKYKRGSTFFFNVPLHSDIMRIESEINLDSQFIKFNQAKLCINTMQVFQEIQRYKKNRIMVIDDEEFCLTATKTLL